MDGEGIKVEAGRDLCWQPNPPDVNPFHENAGDLAVFQTVLRGHSQFQDTNYISRSLV
jgi:hypothetical protein